MHLGTGAVADAELHRHLAAAAVGARVGELDEGGLLVVVGHGGFRDDQGVRALLEDHLGVGRHVGLQLLSGVLDRHLDLEGGDVVLLDADRRDLRDLAGEHLVAEALGGDAGRHAEAHEADVGLVDLAAHEHLLDVAQRHHQGGVGAEVEDRRHRAADFEVAGEHRAADRRLDGRVGQLLFGALGGRLGLRHLGAGLLDLRLADQQLRLRGALAVHRLVVVGARLVERLLRDELLVRERDRPVVHRLGEGHVGGLGFDLVLARLGLGGGERRPGRLEVGAGLAQPCGQVLLVELGQDLAGLDAVIHVHRQPLDDAVGLRLDLDLGDRLDLAGGDHRSGHRAELHRRQARRVDRHRRAVDRRHVGDDRPDAEQRAADRNLPRPCHAIPPRPHAVATTYIYGRVRTGVPGSAASPPVTISPPPGPNLMWMLESTPDAPDTFLFRLLPGAIKTVGPGATRRLRRRRPPGLAPALPAHPAGRRRARRGSREHQRHVRERGAGAARGCWPAATGCGSGRVEFAVTEGMTAAARRQRAAVRAAQSSRNSLVRRSWPMVVSGPWPGCTRASSPNGSSTSVIARINVS